MTIQIKNPATGLMREVEISQAMEAHRAIPVNYFDTILNQINGGMYDRWFEGKKDLTVIDFGANVGLTALYFLSACKKLLCVEPTPSHYELLTQAMSDISKNITLYNFALAEREMDVEFATGHSTENKITSTDGWGNGKITVQAKPLSYFIDEAGGHVDFCKIDIEGYENKALTQEQIDYAFGKVKTFFVELHPGYNLGFDEIARELQVRFLQAGYNFERVDFQTIVATL